MYEEILEQTNFEGVSPKWYTSNETVIQRVIHTSN